MTEVDEHSNHAGVKKMAEKQRHMTRIVDGGGAGAGEVSRMAGEVAVPDYRPRMVSHRYWRAKQEFQLREDTYAHWVVFAVEDGQFTYEINGEKGVASRGILYFVRLVCLFIVKC